MTRSTLLFALLVATLAACGKTEEPTPTTAETAPPPMAAPAPEAMPAPTPAPAPEAAPAPAPEAAPAPAPAKPAAAPAPAQAPVAAAEPAKAAADPGLEAGKAKYNTVCAGCHGKAAQGQAAFPKLAGQTAAMLADKLKRYKAGEKIGPQSTAMMPFARALSEAEIEQVSAYVASL